VVTLQVKQKQDKINDDIKSAPNFQTQTAMGVFQFRQQNRPPSMDFPKPDETT
jgi:hypothetical protein